MSNHFNQSIKLGVLGGGQLGKMLVQSAMDFNLDVNILDPDKNAPCRNLVSNFEVGDLKNFDDVYRFGKQCDVVTIEIENVNVQALKKLEEEGIKVFPQPRVIELIQDKRSQKQFYKENNIPTADFIITQGKQDVASNLNFLPAVNKLGKEGYDGRGVQILRSENDLNKAFDKPGLLEKLIDFEKEISVIVARSKSGEVVSFPIVELVFDPVHNLVQHLFSPADVSEKVEKRAREIAVDVIEKLEMVGLLAVEMFLDKDGNVLVNEAAPRTHNSGHQTIEGNITSQFEQHLRSILGWPLGDTAQLIPTAMVNILGEDGIVGEAIYEGMDDVLKTKGVHIHLYGKKITKPQRKMGHVTIVGSDRKELMKKVDFVKQTLKVKA